MAMPTVDEVSDPARNVPVDEDAVVLPDPNVVAAPALPAVPTQVGVTHLGHEVVAHPSGDITVHDAGFSAKRGLPVDPNGKALVDSHFGHTALAPLIRGPIVDARPAPKEPEAPSTIKDVLNGARKQAASLPLTPAEEQATGEHPYAATAVATPLALGPMAADAVTDKFKTPQQLNADKVANTKEPVVVRVKADGTSDDTDIVPIQKEAPKPIEPALVGTTKDNQEIIRSADGKPLVVPAGTASRMKLATDPAGADWLKKVSPLLASALDNTAGDFSTRAYAEDKAPLLNRFTKAAEVIPDAIASAPGTLKNIVSGGVHQARGEPLTPEEERVTGNHALLASGVATASTVAHKLMNGLGLEADNPADKPKAVAPAPAPATTGLPAGQTPVFAPGTQPPVGSVSVSTKSASRPGAAASGPDESAFKGRMAQNENIRQEENAAAKAEVDAQNSADKSKAAGLENRAYGAEQYSQMDKANLDQYQKEAAETSAKYMKVADELVNSKIDRHKLFKDVAERGHTMQLVIGSLLYGFGAGGLGQDPDIISKLVDKNVADQEADLANHAKGGEMYNTHLGQLASRLKDKNAAVEALRGAYYKQAGDMLDAAALRAGLPANDAKLLRAKAVTDRGFLDAEEKIHTNVLNDNQNIARTQDIKTDTALKGQTYQMNQAALEMRKAGMIPGQPVVEMYGQQVPISPLNGRPERQEKVADEMHNVYSAHAALSDAVGTAKDIITKAPWSSSFASSGEGKRLIGQIVRIAENTRKVQGVSTSPTSELLERLEDSLRNGKINDKDEILKAWEDVQKSADTDADSFATYHHAPPMSALRQAQKDARASVKAENAAKYGAK